MEGTPRSGEEAVYAGFGLEQTQRGARRVGLTTTPIKLSQEPQIMMSNQNVVRAAYYLRISTEEQELDNQRREIIPFIERRGWKLIHPFEDVISGQKSEEDRPG